MVKQTHLVMVEKKTVKLQICSNGALLFLCTRTLFSVRTIPIWMHSYCRRTHRLLTAGFLCQGFLLSLQNNRNKFVILLAFLSTNVLSVLFLFQHTK